MQADQPCLIAKRTVAMERVLGCMKHCTDTLASPASVQDNWKQLELSCKDRMFSSGWLQGLVKASACSWVVSRAIRIYFGGGGAEIRMACETSSWVLSVKVQKLLE